MVKAHGLFTRQQIATLTHISDSTLNFWMREGVLRATEGGGGKGQHRRFHHSEVNLAAILERLRRFAISIEAMRQLSARFHAGFDYIEALGLSDDELTAAHRMAEWWAMSIGDDLYALPAHKTDFVGQPRHETDVGYFSTVVHVSKAEIIAETKRYKFGSEHFNERSIAVSEKINIDEYREHSDYHSAIAYIPPRRYDREMVGLSCFYLGSDGGWRMTHDDSKAKREAEAFIAIPVEGILSELWHPEFDA